MLANIVQLRAFVRREGIGILHCNSVPVLALARLVAGRRRIVFTCHDFLSHPAKLFLVARCPDSIVSVSAAIRDDLVRKGIRLPNAAIHNGFIDEAAEPPPPTPHAPPRIALLGRLVPWKGCDLFVEAAANLRSRGIAAEFRLIGEFDDPAYRARLMAKAEAAGVLWFPFDEDKRSLYGQLDIVVNASIEPEPFGRTLAEAAMFGLPAAGPAEIIRHGITGVTFRSGDAGALAEALGSLAADPGLRAKLGNEARADFPRRFSIAAIAGRIAREVYDEIPGAKGRP
jgi:glycosyltransferase involved in cell wall biosynthesis